MIGYKNPDFIHNDKNKVIEVCNSFHHHESYSDKRIKHFKKYDYKCCVLWDVLFGYNPFEKGIVQEEIILDLLNKGGMM